MADITSPERALLGRKLDRRLLTIIICAGIVLAISMGFRQSLGLYLTPIMQGRGIAREEFALGIGLMNLVWGLFSPIAGAFADRHGALRVIAIGGVFYSAGLLSLTQSGSEGALVGSGILIGLGLSGAGFTVVLGAVGRAAPPRYRGLALGLASLGSSIGQFAAIPYTHVLIEGIGWYASVIVLSCTTVLIVLLSLGFRGAPQPAPDEEHPARALTIREAIGEAVGTRGYLLLNLGFFVCGFHLAFVAVHLPAYLIDQGLEPWVGATALTLIGLANIIGTYGFSWMGTVIARKDTLAILYFARAVIFFCFIMAPVSPTSVFIFAIALGLTWLGTVPVTSALVAYMFGPAYLSTLFGIVFVGHQVGGFLGAWLSGYVFDASHSYQSIWWASVVLGLLSAAIHFIIDERPTPRLQQASS